MDEKKEDTRTKEELELELLRLKVQKTELEVMILNIKLEEYFSEDGDEDDICEDCQHENEENSNGRFN